MEKVKLKKCSCDGDKKKVHPPWPEGYEPKEGALWICLKCGKYLISM